MALRLSSSEFWELTPAEFMLLRDEWQAVEILADRRSALICSVLANIHRDSKRRPDPFSIEDFMPGTGAAKPKYKQQSPEDQIRVLEQFTAAWNAQVKGANSNGR